MVCAALNPFVFGSIDAQPQGFENAMLNHVSTQLFPASWRHDDDPCGQPRPQPFGFIQAQAPLTCNNSTTYSRSP